MADRMTTRQDEMGKRRQPPHLAEMFRGQYRDEQRALRSAFATSKRERNAEQEAVSAIEQPEGEADQRE